MRNLFYLTCLTALIGCLLSCSKPEQNAFQIKGRISGMPHQTIILEELGFNESRMIDSTHADEAGNFVLTGNYKDPGVYCIKMDDRFLLLVVDGPEIAINAQWNKLPEFTATGSPGTESLNYFLVRYNQYNQNIIGLRMSYDSLAALSAPDSLLGSIEAQIDQESRQLSTFIKGFSDTTHSLPAAIYAASNFLLTDETAYLEKFAGTLSERFESTPLTIDFTAEVRMKIETEQAQHAGPKTGSLAPDFKAPSLAGNELRLSSFRGKYILLDFWASWCPPCRAENPNVVAAYHTFKDKNFTIISVSLDQDKAKWQQAITEDQLVWTTHVSELNGWDSKIASDYGVQAIPMNFLIDPSGMIIDLNLRGDQLQATLQKYLGNPSAKSSGPAANP